MIELHIADGIVDSGYLGRVAHRPFDPFGPSVLLGTVGSSSSSGSIDGTRFGPLAVDAPQAHLAQLDADLASRAGCRHVLWGGGEHFDLATDEAVKRIEMMGIGRAGQEAGLMEFGG